MAAHTVQPEHVLSQVEDLNKIGREEESLELIHDYISNKRGKVWSHALESLMKKHIDLSLKHEKHSLIKEGLAAYRNITQSVNVSSLSAVLKYYRKEVEGLFERSIKDVPNPNEFLMEIEEEDNPEDMLLNTLDNKFNKTKEEVSKKWKLLMEAYRTELELIYKNRKLEELYADVAMIGLTKCKRYNRKGEFKRLSEMIRMHQLNNVKAIEKIGINLNHSAFALNLKAPETNQRLITLRFKQLDLAKELKLWQDAYKIMEDINTLMRFRKKSNVDDFFMYFQSLSQVFWNSNHYHLHAVSLHSYVAYLRKRNEEAKTIAENVNYLILAAISIPKGTQTEENINNEFFRRNCSLINSAGQIMSRDQLLANLRTGLYLELCSPEVKSIFQLITDCKDILQYSREVEKTFNKLKQNPTFQKYLPLIEHNIIASLVEKMSGLYKSLSFSTFRKLLGFLDFAKCEKFLLYSQTAGGVDVQIDYEKDMILFGHDGSYGDKVSANLVNLANNLCITEKNLTRLKMQESNEMNQLKSQCLNNARHYVDKAEEDLRNKREESQKLVAQKTNPIMLQRDEIARKRQLEEEQRRREQLKLQEQLVNEQRKLNIVIQRAKNVIQLDKNATLKGKRLDAFSEVDYHGVTIEDLKDVEEFIKNKKAKAEEDKIEKQFKNRDYLEREYRKKRNQMIKEEAEKANVNFEELHKEAQEKHKRRLELKGQFINIRSFVEEFKAKTQDARIKKFETEIEKYRSAVTLAVAEKLVQRATELKTVDDEAKKTENENQKIIDSTPVRPQGSGAMQRDNMPVYQLDRNTKTRAEIESENKTTGSGLTAPGGASQVDNKKPLQPTVLQRGTAARGEGVPTPATAPVTNQAPLLTKSSLAKEVTKEESGLQARTFKPVEGKGGLLSQIRAPDAGTPAPLATSSLAASVNESAKGFGRGLLQTTTAPAPTTQPASTTGLGRGFGLGAGLGATSSPTKQPEPVKPATGGKQLGGRGFG